MDFDIKADETHHAFTIVSEDNSYDLFTFNVDLDARKVTILKKELCLCDEDGNDSMVEVSVLKGDEEDIYEDLIDQEWDEYLKERS